ncbi:MAG TPA: S8 family serine peptidase, partial [Verrucomicrobiae bacterium]|nr:S8 family serine peptidase [Verrucomicrobiae bacterium]
MRSPASGLYLIQFENHLTATERSQLQADGVRLLQYVPDDAFIARLKNISPDTVQALNFVRWIGPYEAGYKLAPRLLLRADKAQKENQSAMTNIVVLISRDATTAEINGVKSVFSTVRQQSNLRMGIILRGKLSLDKVSALARSDSVLWIEPQPKHKLIDEAASKVVGGDDGNVATPTVTEQLGFDGSGVTVCVADTGLDTGDTNTMHPDLSGRVTGFQVYGDLPDGSDGYGHGTHCAGIIAGNAATGETDPDSGQLYGLGVASGANLFIERIFDDNANEADPFPADETLATDAVRAGAQIGANSWGNEVQGQYDLDAAAFDELVRDADSSTPGDQPYILEFSAGNAGPGSETMDSPACAKNVIATGASENVPGTLAGTYGLYADGADTMADFSSRGPCEDGRIKPDVVAPGTWIASLASSVADESAVAWTVIDGYYVYMGGTSMAGPHAAGAAAVFVQYYQSLHDGAVPSPALVKAALINSAQELDNANGGPGSVPNFDEGWGRVTLTNIITTNLDSAPRNYLYLDETKLLSTGQTYEQHTLVRNSGQPLKVTLAYTDVPGFPGAIPALVNDLDLEVVAPDGTLYRGNQFIGDESEPNAPTPDNINNVEGVYLANPEPGDYQVRVRARDVEEDARLDTSEIDQDFALVISGDLARGNHGDILFDRTNYTAPGTINVVVFDLARAASNSVSIFLKSTTEPGGETIVLNSAGNYGAFTGAVATVEGPAAADGKLEIHNGDSIEADYMDSSGNLQTATATADLIAPTLSNVATTVDLGVNTITWQTSEPSDSVVHSGTNGLDLNLISSRPALSISHTVKLGRLIPGKTYYFYVTSSDAAGNTVTNDNSGANFSFVAAQTPTVLLVDDYDAPGEEAAGSPVIDDGVYTNAIAAAGYTFAHWKVLDRGSPEFFDLQPYPVVIWRTTDDIVNYGVDSEGFPDPNATNNTLNTQQQFALQNYVNDGGSFFMASMNILEQIGNVSFRRNVLHVNQFAQNSDPPAACSDCDEDYGVPEFFGTGNPITDGMYVTLDYSNYPSFDLGDGTVLGPDFSDTFTPDGKSQVICNEAVSGKPCGMSYPRAGVESPGRVVFLSFPL